MESQLKRGLLEVCVLAAIREQDSYGYKMIKDLSPHIEITESTLYPILKRLEKAGKLKVYSVEHQSRLRKYYSITQEGLNQIADFVADWPLVEKAFRFIEGDEKYE